MNNYVANTAGRMVLDALDRCLEIKRIKGKSHDWLDRKLARVEEALMTTAVTWFPKLYPDTTWRCECGEAGRGKHYCRLDGWED